MAAFSPDGSFGAVVLPGALILVEVGSWNVWWKILPRGPLDALAFSPDGGQLAISARAFRSRSPIGEPMDPYALVQVVETSTGRVLREVEGKGATATLGLCFDRGNSLLAAVTRYNAEITLWNVSSGKITPIYTSQSRFRSAAFAPGGDLLALAVTTVRGLNEYELNIYDTRTGSLLAGLGRGSSQAQNHAIAFSPDGALLAFGTEDWDYQNLKRGEIRVYDTAERKLVRSIKNLDAAFYSLQFQNDGKSIAGLGSDPYSLDLRPATWDRKLRIWDALTGKLQTAHELKAPDGIARSQVRIFRVPGHDFFCVAAYGGVFSFYQPGDSRPVAAISPSKLMGTATPQGSSVPVLPTRGPVVSVHRILALFVSGDGKLSAGSDNGVLYSWDLPAARVIPNRNQIASSAKSMALSPNGTTVAVANPEGTVDVGNTADGLLRSLTAFSAAATALAFSPDGAWLAAGSRDGGVILWRPDAWEAMPQLRGHGGAVRALAFTRDSELLASGADDLAVRIWDLKSARTIHTLQGHKQTINAAAFGADGAILATGADDSAVILWNARAGSVAKKLSGHKGAVRGVCISPDGAMVASGGDDGVRLWNAKTGKLIRVLLERRPSRTSRPPETRFFAEAVNSLAFSPDGRILACGGGNNALVVWDTASWKSRPFRAGN